MQNRKIESQGFTIEIAPSDPVVMKKHMDELFAMLDSAFAKEKKIKPVVADMDFSVFEEYLSEINKTSTEYFKASEGISSTTKALTTTMDTIQVGDYVNFVNHTFPSFRKEFIALHAQYKSILDSKIQIPPITADLLKKIPSALHPEAKGLFDCTKRLKSTVDSEFGKLQKINKVIVEFGAKVIGNFKEAKARKEAAAAGGAAPVQPVSQQSGASASIPSFMHNHQDSQKKATAAAQPKPPGGPSVPNGKSQK